MVELVLSQSGSDGEVLMGWLSVLATVVFVAIVIGGLRAGAKQKSGSRKHNEDAPRGTAATNRPSTSGIAQAPQRVAAEKPRLIEPAQSNTYARPQGHEHGSPSKEPAPAVPAVPAEPVFTSLQASRPDQSKNAGIFISYRRQDEPNFAGRLYDRLATRFGRGNVFMDVDTIELGVDFTEVIDMSLSRCQVMIVIIGKGWAQATDEDGELRLNNPDDYVRLEIEKALRSTARVIPVLVEGAAIPKSTQLPQPLTPLSRRNGIQMSHASFGSDADRLIETLGRLMGNSNV